MSKKKNSAKKIVLKLRDIRREKGMSINDVASKVGVGYQTIGRVERGETQMTVENLYKISKVLNVPLSKLLGEESIADFSDGLCEDKPKSTDVYTIPVIYDEFEHLCNKYKISVENQVKVYLATTVFKAIQDIHINARDEKDMVKAFFRAFDAIFERLVLIQG